MLENISNFPIIKKRNRPLPRLLVLGYNNQPDTHSVLRSLVESYANVVIIFTNSYLWHLVHIDFTAHLTYCLQSVMLVG